MPALAPSPKFRAVGADGLALVGGKLYSYIAGTSTPKLTYTDFTLGTANANPVILNSRGECDLWLNGNYKLTLTDAADAVIWSVDDIRDLTSSATFTNATLAGTLTVTSTAVTWSGNPIHSGNHEFTNNVVVKGNTTLGDSSADTLTINPNAVTWSNPVTHSNNHTHSGNVSVAGTLTASAVAPVFTFGATVGNTARADVTVLDWYEEDQGTSQVSINGSSVAGTANYIQRTLYWQRVGNRVHFNFLLTYDTFTGTGNTVIRGLPYTPVDSQTPISIMSDSLTFSNQLSASITTSSGGQIELKQVSSGGAIAPVAVDAAASIWGSGTYRV